MPSGFPLVFSCVMVTGNLRLLIHERNAPMSKLAEAIRRSQRVESTPMGFGAVRAATKPTMLVGYYGAAAGVDAAVAAGAELIIVEGDLSDDEAKKACAAASDLSVGVAAKSL